MFPVFNTLQMLIPAPHSQITKYRNDPCSLTARYTKTHAIFARTIMKVVHNRRGLYIGFWGWRRILTNQARRLQREVWMVVDIVVIPTLRASRRRQLARYQNVLQPFRLTIGHNEQVEWGHPGPFPFRTPSGHSLSTLSPSDASQIDLEEPYLNAR